MDKTYSDLYAFLPEDPRAEPYFRSLPGFIQDQIKGLERYPSTYEELLDAVDQARQVF